MSRNEMISKIEQLKEWEAILEEAQSEVEALRDSIKAQMLEEDTEELAVGTYIIRWTSVLSNRFDSTAFKKRTCGTLQDIYKAGCKQAFQHSIKKTPFQEPASKKERGSPPDQERACSL